MTTYFGKSCSFCLPRVPFVNCRQFMYLVISLLVLRAGYGIWLYQFLIIAYLFTYGLWQADYYQICQHLSLERLDVWILLLRSSLMKWYYFLYCFNQRYCHCWMVASARFEKVFTYTGRQVVWYPAKYWLTRTIITVLHMYTKYTIWYKTYLCIKW